MAKNSKTPIKSLSRFSFPNVPITVLGVALVAIFTLGIVATALLAVATQSAESQLGQLLGLLLGFSDFLPFIVLVGIVPAIIYSWQNRSRLARRLMFIMLFQFGLATIMAVLPFWIISETTATYFDESVDTVVANSEYLSTYLLSQSHLHLENSSKLSLEEKESLLADSLTAGIVIDKVRDNNSLDIVALIDSSGRVLSVSPVDAVIENITPFVMQRVNSGEAVVFLFDDEDRLRLVRVEPLDQVLSNSPFVGLWVERALSSETSATIRGSEQSSRSYRRSKALRVGVQKALTVVIVNAISLLLFVAIYLSVYTGTRLGRRLGTLSSAMEEVAAMSVPSGNVPVTGSDEITSVSESFNEMVTKVGQNVEREKRAREESELIQNAINAGLIVLDYRNRVVRSNRTAARLLGLKKHKEKHPSLEQIKEKNPNLTGLCDLLSEVAETINGEIVLNERKILVHTVPKGKNSQSRIVLFTDISEPLAVEELRARQDALNFTLHGIKNPLQPLLYHVESLDKLMGQLDEKDAEFLQRKREALLHNIHRINEQIEGMRSLVSKTPMRYVPVDINSAVRTVTRHWQQGDLHIDYDLAIEPVVALYDREEISDAIENLLINSKQQFEVQKSGYRIVKITTRMNETMAELIFEDNAGGVNEDRIDKIFKPHVSYKATGQGLGLARIDNSLKKAGGSIIVTNIKQTIGVGARFTITLPKAQTRSL